jgi:hypothetical protein
MVCKYCEILPVRMERFDGMNAFVRDIVAGNRLVKMQSRGRTLIALRPVVRMGNFGLLENSDRCIIASAVSEKGSDVESACVTKSFQ